MRDHDKGKKPTQLYGEGFDDEARKITHLTRYLDFETWTPIEAAMLVCGLAPHDDCQQIPEKGAFSLDGVLMMGNSDPFHHARWILKLWCSQEKSPDKVRPVDFIAWCKTKKIDTGWITNADEWEQYANPLVAFLDENGISHTLADKIQKSQQVAELKAEAVENGEVAGQNILKSESTKIMQFNSNELDFSGLLNKPSGQDDWFEVIDLMTKAFYSEHEVMPTNGIM